MEYVDLKELALKKVRITGDIIGKFGTFEIEQIYKNVWEDEAYAAENIIAVHIRHIREKIEINPKEPRYLKVIWGIGYKIEKI